MARPPHPRIRLVDGRLRKQGQCLLVTDAVEKGLGGPPVRVRPLSNRVGFESGMQSWLDGCQLSANAIGDRRTPKFSEAISMEYGHIVINALAQLTR